ncbi:ribonuclease D [Epidermidibacterium keratini]|uniref:Ribonuclease D n=1 Tax=Epidermidibacterium keratini TaxID=1891644 RepID=A0A7L4YST8_9ACTN|nr:HRDC domain-containing protein [Epidermidibacterium keratini]QHC01974.1 ribonuclease D [Epidermidibacterium keratini]
MSPRRSSDADQPTPTGSDPAAAEGPTAAGPAPTPLRRPRGGKPPLITDPADVQRVADQLAAGTGPVGVDAERASGYRYSARAQLVQLHRAGAGIVLIDPIATGDLSAIGEALSGVEWVLHAAVADLECLADVGMRPDSLFDTELGGRLAGYERVALGTMTENLLGLSLAKGHSAADWSTRPLPGDYLTYAALDVDVLLELRDAVETELREQGKLDWAREEFEAVRTAQPAPPRPDPWRRTSGLSKVKDRRGVAIVQSLWTERDRIGQEQDLAPGRLLPDRTIVAAALAQPRSLQDMLELDGFTRRTTITFRRQWWKAIARALDLREVDLPPRTAPPDPHAPPSRWMGKEPDVAERYAAARAVVLAESERLSIPAENLMPPQAIRSLAWDPPTPITAESVDARMREYRARDWQRALLAAPVTTALVGVPTA